MPVFLVDFDVSGDHAYVVEADSSIDAATAIWIELDSIFNPNTMVTIKHLTDNSVHRGVDAVLTQND